jgi:hypothetical protein
MHILKVLAASALILAGSASAIAASQAGEARLTRILEGRVAGKPVDCIYLPQIRSTQVISGTAIVYDAGRTIYVNRPEGGARSLSSGDVLVTKPHANQLCDVDIVRVLDQGTHFPRGFVSLGDFVPYTKAPKLRD